MRSSRPFLGDEPTPSDRLLVVLDKETCNRWSQPILPLANDAVTAGARRFWYRNYVDPPGIQLEEARALSNLLIPVQGALLVGGRPDIALEVGAAGVHLPGSGISVGAARKINPTGWVGRSCHNLEDVLQAQQEGADYVTLSPVYTPISPKPHPRPALGLPLFEQIVQSAVIPVYALGGIGPSNAAHCLRCGAFGVAVLGTVAGARHLGVVVEGLLGVLASELPMTDGWGDRRRHALRMLVEKESPSG